jgi:DNA-binding IclR family transcriptional regulator
MSESPQHPRSGITSQTLDRGIAVLEYLSEHPGSASVATISEALALDRTVVYRLLNTLAQRRLAMRDSVGRFSIGMGVFRLARHAVPPLMAAAAGELRRLADQVGALSILTVADGDEANCIATAEPPGSAPQLVHRPGFRHPLDRAAAGIAILAGNPPRPGEREAVARARSLGYATSCGEVLAGAMGIAAPIVVDGRNCEASIGVAGYGQLDERSVSALVLRASKVVIAALQ